MISVFTTKFAERGEKGNCLAAALASILHLKIEDVPEFEEMCKSTWKPALRKWSSDVGASIEFTTSIPKGFSVGVGIHKSGGFHAVVLKDGFFFFDPNGTDLFYEQHRYCLDINFSKDP